MKFFSNLFPKLDKRGIFVFLLIALNPCIDILYTITKNILELEMIVNFNQMIRIVILIIMFFMIKRKQYKLHILIFGIAFLFSNVINIYFGMPISLIGDLAFYSKLLYGVTAYFWIVDSVENKDIGAREVYNALIVGTIFMAFCIIISIFGVGFESYGENSIRWGYKGLFAGQNVVALINFVGLFIYNLRFHNAKWYKIILGSFIYILAAIIIGTKGSILFTFLSMIVLIVFYLLLHKNKIIKYYRENRKKILYISFFVLIALLIISLIIAIYFYFYFKKLDYFNSFYSFLVSGRNRQLKEAISIFTNDFSNKWMFMFFGLSYTYFDSILTKVYYSYHSLEQDFFALLLYTGIIGTSLFACLFRKVYCYIISTISDMLKPLHFLALCSFILILIYSFFIGHFLFEAIACFYIWIYFGTFKFIRTKKVITTKKQN